MRDLWKRLLAIWSCIKMSGGPAYVDIVGSHGRERLYFPKGARIAPMQKISLKMGEIRVYGDPEKAKRLLKRMMKDMTRDAGDGAEVGE